MPIEPDAAVQSPNPLVELLQQANMGEEHHLSNGADQFTRLDPGTTINDYGSGNLVERKDFDWIGRLNPELGAALRGSELLPDQFLEMLGVSEHDRGAIASELLSQRTSDDNGGKPIYEFSGEGERHSFKLNVMHGSFNEHSMRISELAPKLLKLKDDIEKTLDEDHKDSLVAEQYKARKEYQDHDEALATPVLKQGMYDENGEIVRNFDMREIDDCGATAETAMLTAKLLQEYTNLFEDIGRRPKFRVDLITATTQSVLVMRQFAKELGWDLEVNVGNLAYGLSEGEKVGIKSGFDVFAHSHYLTYPRSLENIIDPAIWGRIKAINPDGEVQVVGDKGDAFESLPKDDLYDYRFVDGEFAKTVNAYRHDPHGVRTPDEAYVQPELDDYSNLEIYMANGGYWMKALMDKLGLSLNALMLVVKRIQSEKVRTGVVVKDIPEEILRAA